MNKKYKKPIKILLVTNIPTPYRIPLFNELNRQFKRRNMEFKVVFSALSYPRRKWETDLSQCRFNYAVLNSKRNMRIDAERTVFTYAGLIKLIKIEKPDLIITSGFSLATIKIWFLSLFYPVSYIIWSGCISGGKDTRSFIRKAQRKILVKRAAGFIAYGTLSKRYLISLGGNPSRISVAINTVGINYFKKIKTPQKKEKKEILYVGNYTKGKRLDLLFYAIRALLSRRCDFLLRLVGDGSEYHNLKILSKKLGIKNFINFEGFKQKEQVREYFANADCFLFPSEYDIWGLVLVEAMAAGLPCIASVRAGATHDLIRDGVTGFAMDFTESEKVAEKVDWILSHPDLSREIGKNAQLFVSENVSLEKSANGFIEAVNRVLENIEG